MLPHWIPTGRSHPGPVSRLRDLFALGYRGLRRSRSMLRYTIAAGLSAFTHSLRQNLPFSPGFEDAVATAQWLDAAARSTEVGRHVSRDEAFQLSGGDG
jgi:hypothetical protein